MKIKKIFYPYIAIIILSCLFPFPAWSWDNGKTHKQLTESAVNQSILFAGGSDYLKTLGFSGGEAEILYLPGKVCDDQSGETVCTVLQWLKYGAEKEDAEVFFPLVNFSLRYVNHFHDPLSGEGLHDGLSSGLSAMAWAQDGASQENAVEGDQSWANLRALYYQALTAASEENRQAGFAQLFKGLGHQMHLVQDMAVPAHVRNDAHAEDTLLQVNREQWNDYPHLPLFRKVGQKERLGYRHDCFKIRKRVRSRVGL